MQPVEPDLKLGGFSLWVYGREFPDANDYWDGNWLIVRARVGAPGALVEAQGGFIHAPALADFAKQVETLHATLVGEAVLRRMGPNLEMAIRGDSVDHMELRLMITCDHITQAHDFKFDLDQTHLARSPSLTGAKAFCRVGRSAQRLLLRGQAV